MRRLVLIVLASAALPAAAAAQTYGQPYGGPVSPGYGGYGQTYGYGYSNGSYGDPRAYRPSVQHGHGDDRGGRYGYSSRSGQWTRWSSPPGRGYHDAYGYNDDRAPRGVDRGRHRDQAMPLRRRGLSVRPLKRARRQKSEI